MKIAILNDDYPPRGENSVATIASNLAEEFRKKGHEVCIITTHRPSESPAIIREGAVVSLPCSYRRSLRAYMSLKNKAVTHLIDTELQRMQPDIVHAHNIHMYLTYDALRLAKKHGSKVFITMHDAMSFSNGRLATARYLNSLGRDSHITTMDQIQQARMEWNPLRNIIIRHYLRRYVTRIISVSDALRQALSANSIHNSIVIHNGINANEWRTNLDAVTAFRKKHDIYDKKVILFGGRLSIDKGIRKLLQATHIVRKRIPNTALLVVGEQKRWKGIREQYGSLSDCCYCTGWLGKEEMKVAYAAADIVTTPSLCLDTFNLMNLEAMAMEKPVVGTIFGGAREVIANEETGFLIDPRNIEVYADKMATLLEDKMLAKRMGKAGRKRAEDHFTITRQIDAYLHLFTE